MSTSDYPYTQIKNRILAALPPDEVTCAALVLREAGLINYNRGHIQILDRSGLEAIACECYLAIKNQFKRLVSDGK